MKKLLLSSIAILSLCACGSNSVKQGSKQVQKRYQNVSIRVYDADNVLFGIDIDNNDTTDYVIALNQIVSANKYDFNKDTNIRNEFYIYTDNSMLLVNFN